MAKKVVKTAVTETPESEVKNTIEATDIKVNVEEVINQLKDVNIELPSRKEAIEEMTNNVIESIKPLKEITDSINEINEASVKLNEEIANNPQKAENFIKNEIKKAEEIKDKIDKIINNTKKVQTHNVNNWWNGMGYDF